jgi:hypothetical protein
MVVVSASVHAFRIESTRVNDADCVGQMTERENERPIDEGLRVVRGVLCSMRADG